MPDAIAQLLNEGKVQLFCADAVDGEGLLNGDLPQRRRAELQEKYFVYLSAELAPRILTLNNAKKGARIWTAGVDLGAYHAVHCRLRRPTLFAGAVGMGIAIGKSCEGISRQPEATGQIRTSLMLGLVFIETAIIYSLIIAILIIFVL